MLDLLSSPHYHAPVCYSDHEQREREGGRDFWKLPYAARLKLRECVCVSVSVCALSRNLIFLIPVDVLAL